MITLTEKAISRVKEFAADEGLPPIVRVKVIGKGCAGLETDLSLDDFIMETDEVIEQDGIKVVVDMFSVHYLGEDLVIDFVEDGFVKGFKFLMKDDNLRSCGCGRSFSIG